jgi:hypothetical protein
MKLHMVFVRASRSEVQLKSQSSQSTLYQCGGGGCSSASVQADPQQQQQHVATSNGTAVVATYNGGLQGLGSAALSPVPSSHSSLQPASVSRSLVPSVSAPLLPANGLDVSSSNGSIKSPDKDVLALSPVSPKRHKVRKDRFHKLFPDIAESDVVIKSYHCAYVSDILLQGFLYVTKNWFCFYSKLLGKKRIKISVDNVTSITKTKTAIIIPNAVSIVTETSQYVFGSLMSRDNTFRLLHSIWQQRLVDIEKASAIDIDAGSDATADVDSLTKSINAVSSNSSTDDFVTSSS